MIRYGIENCVLDAHQRMPWAVFAVTSKPFGPGSKGQGDS